MTPDQWRTIVTYIHTNWGTTPAWTKAAHLHTDVHDLPYPTMMTIAREIRNEGRQFPPPPAELIGRTHQRTTTTPTTRPDPTQCTHPVWGYPTPTPGEPPDKVCPRCLTVELA